MNRLKNTLIFSLTLTIISSCVICYKEKGYTVKNCTADTILFGLSDSSDLKYQIFWDRLATDTTLFEPIDIDTMTITVDGEKTIIRDCYYAVPDSLWEHGFYSSSDAPWYLFAITWEVANHYTRDEIIEKKLYDRRVVTKKDFHNRIYEYRTKDSSPTH